jgi:hypothetical protein
MIETIWNFIQNHWVWILVGGFVALSFGRAMNKHPKYRLKEIAKNPLRIFWLFAHAVDEAVGTINDAVELARDVAELVEPVAGQGKFGQAVKTANAVIDKIDAANNVLESADKIAERVGLEDKDLK